MNIKKIIKEEVDDLDWIREIAPIPNGIISVFNQYDGRYKVWFGDITKEQQLIILDYIIDRCKIGNLRCGDTINNIRKRVNYDDYLINSLYFDIDGSRIRTSMMAVYSKDFNPHKNFISRLEYCKLYFHGISDDVEELS